ncbi:hypothetical protein K2P47_03620 [Patescibacteria group bacterium]|nr:hypothetical protein [Patescibacteria group bacterium]
MKKIFLNTTVAAVFGFGLATFVAAPAFACGDCTGQDHEKADKPEKVEKDKEKGDKPEKDGDHNGGDSKGGDHSNDGDDNGGHSDGDDYDDHSEDDNEDPKDPKDPHDPHDPKDPHEPPVTPPTPPSFPKNDGGQDVSTNDVCILHSADNKPIGPNVDESELADLFRKHLARDQWVKVYVKDGMVVDVVYQGAPVLGSVWKITEPPADGKVCVKPHRY